MADTKFKWFGYGWIVVAFAALSLQFLVPHHHHQQAIFLFAESCPTADHTVPEHGTDTCHHPHSESSECSVLDHIVALKQQGNRGDTGLVDVPLLAVFDALQFGIFSSDTPQIPVYYTSPIYRNVDADARKLRGPPAIG